MLDLNSFRFKFRIFDKTAQEYMVPFSDGNLFLYQNSKGQSVYLDFAINRPDFFVVQQWTGLCDKDGIDIYEGDFVNFTTKGFAHEMEPEDWENMLVVWQGDEGGFFFVREYESAGKKVLCEFCMLDGIIKNTLCVVGNNYQN